MSHCAVSTCKNYYKKTRNASENVSYHKIPKGPDDVVEKWKHFCKRRKSLNLAKATICSEHFKPEDYEYGCEKNAHLKSGAVPSISLPSQNVEIPVSGKQADLTDRLHGLRKKETLLKPNVPSHVPLPELKVDSPNCSSGLNKPYNEVLNESGEQEFPLDLRKPTTSPFISEPNVAIQGVPAKIPICRPLSDAGPSHRMDFDYFTNQNLTMTSEEKVTELVPNLCAAATSTSTLTPSVPDVVDPASLLTPGILFEAGPAQRIKPDSFMDNSFIPTMTSEKFTVGDDNSQFVDVKIKQATGHSVSQRGTEQFLSGITSSNARPLFQEPALIRR